jgi:hypothetical protein
VGGKNKEEVVEVQLWGCVRTCSPHLSFANHERQAAQSPEHEGRSREFYSRRQPAFFTHRAQWNRTQEAALADEPRRQPRGVHVTDPVVAAARQQRAGSEKTEVRPGFLHSYNQKVENRRKAHFAAQLAGWASRQPPARQDPEPNPISAGGADAAGTHGRRVKQR